MAEPDAKAYEWEAEGLRNTMAIPCEKLGELFLPSELETAAHAMRREKRRPKSGCLQAAYMAFQCRMTGWPFFPLADGVEVRLASEIQHENEATSGNNKLSVCSVFPLACMAHAHRLLPFSQSKSKSSPSSMA